MRILSLSLALVFCLSIGITNAQNISDEAMRYFDRGQAAVEMAKADMDYEDAIIEFEKAAKLAPEWPDVYYNLGLIQEKGGKYSDAIRNLTKYLELSPNASDAREVNKIVTTIEYKMEKIAEESEMPGLLEGHWGGDWLFFCGGTQHGIVFHKFGDKVSVELSVTWNPESGKREDYMIIPVKIEGKTVRFEFEAKMRFPEERLESCCNIELELKLVEPNKLKGILRQVGDYTREVELIKNN